MIRLAQGFFGTVALMMSLLWVSRCRNRHNLEEDMMNIRRLVGIDLGIASAHTVRVLDGEANTLAKRKAWPTVESLSDIETPVWAASPLIRFSPKP